MLSNTTNNQNIVAEGVCSRAEVVNCSNGTTAIFFDFKNKDGSCTAKWWSVSNPDTSVILNKALKVKGTVTEYKGVKELKVSEVSVLPDTEIKKYVPRLDLDNLCSNFMQFLKSHLTREYYEALKVVFEAVNFEKFVTGYAANSHHDNIMGGLLNHTLKMLQIADVMITQHPELDFMKNRLYAGIIVHDIGKIYCYNDLGSVTDSNYVDHKAFGIEILAENKKAIIELIGVDEYYQLMAIILGHHGEFGEPCHSVATQIVSYIDLLESQVTGLVQLMKQAEFKGEIKFDGKYLKI